MRTRELNGSIRFFRKRLATQGTTLKTTLKSTPKLWVNFKSTLFLTHKVTFNQLYLTCHLAVFPVTTVVEVVVVAGVEIN